MNYEIKKHTCPKHRFVDSTNPVLTSLMCFFFFSFHDISPDLCFGLRKAHIDFRTVPGSTVVLFTFFYSRFQSPSKKNFLTAKHQFFMHTKVNENDVQRSSGSLDVIGSILGAGSKEP